MASRYVIPGCQNRCTGRTIPLLGTDSRPPGGTRAAPVPQAGPVASSTPPSRNLPLALRLGYLAGALWLLSAPGLAGAQSGAIDPTFGTGGIVTTPVGSLDDFGQAIAIQDDDKIVVAGDSESPSTSSTSPLPATSSTVRSTPPSAAPARSSWRWVRVSMRPSRSRCRTTARSSSPAPPASGSNDNFAVVRLLANGQLDTSFDGDGIVVTSMSSTDDEALAVVIQDDGKILVGGWAAIGGNHDLALARYDDDGSLDGSFGGGDGKVTLAVGTGPNAGDDEVASLFVLADDKIIVGGTSAFGSLSDMLVARLTSAGAFDTTFGGGTGFTRIHFGAGNDNGKAVALTLDDDILIAGDARVGTVSHFGVARVNANGTIDTLFGGGDGIATTTIGSKSEGRSLAVFPEGRFVVAGFATVSGNDDFATVRYNTDGTPDTNFSFDGIVTTPIGSSVDEAQRGRDPERPEDPRRGLDADLQRRQLRRRALPAQRLRQRRPRRRRAVRRRRRDRGRLLHERVHGRGRRTRVPAGRRRLRHQRVVRRCERLLPER